MTGYTRVEAASIVTGNTIEASHFNNEYNQIELAFDGVMGHSHDGSVGNAPAIDLTTSVSGILPIANGGTNAATEMDARINLGVDIGVDVQAFDPLLESFSSLVTAPDKMFYSTALDVVALTDLTAYARTLLATNNSAEAQAVLNIPTAADQSLNTTDSVTFQNVTVPSGGRFFMKGGLHQISNNDGTGNINFQFSHSQEISTVAGSPMTWTLTADNLSEGFQNMEWKLFDATVAPGVPVTGATVLRLDRVGLSYDGVYFSSDGHNHADQIIIVNMNYAASDQEKVGVDTLGGPITITAPPSPVNMTYFAVSDITSNAATNNITVDFGAPGFEGVPNEDYVININRHGQEFIYYSGSWRFFNGFRN